MRIFIGVKVPESVSRNIYQALVNVLPLIRKGKPAKPEGYHLTLKFIGEVPDDKTEQLIQAMSIRPLTVGVFQLELDGLGCFSKKKGDVLWLGIKPSESLLALHDWVEVVMESLGAERDDAVFVPHLTLGRGIRYVHSFKNMLEAWQLSSQSFIVDSLMLFQSVQVEGQLIYLPLVEKPLSQNAN